MKKFGKQFEANESGSGTNCFSSYVKLYNLKVRDLSKIGLHGLLAMLVIQAKGVTSSSNDWTKL